MFIYSYINIFIYSYEYIFICMYVCMYVRMYRLRAQKFKDREKLLGDEKEKLEVHNLLALLVQKYEY
jgi:hypothetical protein